MTQGEVQIGPVFGYVRTCPRCQRYTSYWSLQGSEVCQLCETGIESEYAVNYHCAGCGSTRWSDQTHQCSVASGQRVYGPDAPPVTISPRQQVLDMAKKAVLTDRNNTHGEPEDTFAAIAALWDAWDRHKSINRGDGHDVAVKMLLLKVARMGQGELNIDDYGDAAGYASCAYEAAVKEKKVV